MEFLIDDENKSLNKEEEKNYFYEDEFLISPIITISLLDILFLEYSEKYNVIYFYFKENERYATLKNVSREDYFKISKYFRNIKNKSFIEDNTSLKLG